MTSEAQIRFHAHLDICTQCRENPMMLCRIGAVLLSRAATEDMPTPKDETNERTV